MRLCIREKRFYGSGKFLMYKTGRETGIMPRAADTCREEHKSPGETGWRTAKSGKYKDGKRDTSITELIAADLRDSKSSKH